MNARRNPRSPIASVITLASLLFLYAPLVIVVLFSFNKTAALSFPFAGFSLRWYRQIFESADFRSALNNSLLVAASVAAVTLVLASMAALALSRSPRSLQAPLSFLFFLPITLPGLFLGIALLVFFVRIKVHLSLLTVSIAHSVYVFPYFFLIAKVALDRLDVTLEETAADLGADGWKTFWYVTLPQAWPVILGATFLAFALSLDEFLITFFVVGSSPTLPLFIWSSLRREVDPSINTVSTILMASTLALWMVAFFVFRLTRRRTPVLEITSEYQ